MAATPLAGQEAARHAGSAPAHPAQPPARTVYIGGSVILAAIPGPFAWSCSRMEDVHAGLGVQAYVGVRSSRGWDLRVRYAGVREADIEECVLGVPVEPDEVHRRRTYESELWGHGIRTMDVQAGFAPPPLDFLRVAVGAGVEVDRGVPFLLGGVGVSLGSRVQVVAGADVLLFPVPYIIQEEEWQDSRLLRRSRVEDGEVWRRAWSFHLGAQLPIGRR